MNLDVPTILREAFPGLGGLAAFAYFADKYKLFAKIFPIHVKSEREILVEERALLSKDVNDLQDRLLERVKALEGRLDQAEMAHNTEREAMGQALAAAQRSHADCLQENHKLAQRADALEEANRALAARVERIHRTTVETSLDQVIKLSSVAKAPDTAIELLEGPKESESEE